MKPIRVLVAGRGNMGQSHALAYHKLEGFELAGVVCRSKEKPNKLFSQIGKYPLYDDFDRALAAEKPDAVSVNTWTDTHAAFSLAAFESGAHVFLEKPIAENMRDAEAVVAAARRTGRKLVVGYILNHHPSWKEFIKLGRSLGKPLVMRMNLNQQSSGASWETHKHLMKSCSPIVDCGVHYVDVMCQLTQSKPVRVHAIGARLTDDIHEDMYNYGQLQVTFDDGSVGWYEAGWGPMMSQEAYFIKDVIGPRGSVSMKKKSEESESSKISGHTETQSILHHQVKKGGKDMVLEDVRRDMQEEPGHQELCDLEQAFFLKAIREDLDLSAHHQSALNSLRIVLAADESYRTKQVVEL